MMTIDDAKREKDNAMQKVQFETLGKTWVGITRNYTMQECFVPANSLTWGVVEMIFGAKCQVMDPEDYRGMLRCVVKNGRGRAVGEIVLF